MPAIVKYLPPIEHTVVEKAWNAEGVGRVGCSSPGFEVASIPQQQNRQPVTCSTCGGGRPVHCIAGVLGLVGRTQEVVCFWYDLHCHTCPESSLTNCGLQERLP